MLNDSILIDCGVSYRTLTHTLTHQSECKTSVKRALNVVLLTHIHGDHFNPVTIRQLARDRPILRFACCEWLLQSLLDCGVSQRSIDVMQIGKKYDYGAFKVSPVKLYHDVDNCGWRVYIGNEKAIYMTDTHTLDGITAKDYDLYMVEANYTEAELQQRIQEKQEAGLYVYEHRVVKTHLSKEQCDSWLIQNMGENSEYVYLHQHKERR